MADSKLPGAICRVIAVGEDIGARTRRVVLKFDAAIAVPAAPAGIYAERFATAEVFPLHRMAEQYGTTYCFETYDCPQPLPPMGSLWFYRGWWLPEAMAAACDREATWERRLYPDDGSEQLCLFTFTVIAAHAPNREGYLSRHGWATVNAYNAIIRDDIYRLRRDD